MLTRKDAKRTLTDKELAKEYADARVKEKTHLTMMDHGRMAAAFEAGMAKQREKDENREDNLSEMGKAYVRVCRKLGINGNVFGYVRRLGEIADRFHRATTSGDGRGIYQANMEYKAEFLSGKESPAWIRPKEKDDQ